MLLHKRCSWLELRVVKWDDPCPYWEFHGKCSLKAALRASAMVLGIRIFRISLDGTQLLEGDIRFMAIIGDTTSDNMGEDLEDVISIGTIGLNKAIGSFSPNKCTKLATFAVRCIENEFLMQQRSYEMSLADFLLLVLQKKISPLCFMKRED
jgi:hypothetical protein